MKTKQLGNTKLKVSEIGLGCMGMSEFYGIPNERSSIDTLHRALALGVNFFDTADIYGMGANEELLARAFKDQWNKIILATKVGIKRDPVEFKLKGVNGSAEYIKASCDASLKRLQIDVIDLYYLHRLDPQIPIEESIGALADLVRVGKVRYIGLCEVNRATLEKANQIHPITALQSEYSLWTREPEKEIIPLCEKLDISFVAYSPLGRGFLTSKIDSLGILKDDDYRKTNPRFSPENFNRNYSLVKELKAIADEKACSPAELALAWILAKSHRIIPIPGTKNSKYLEENIAAAEIQLSTEDLAKLDNLFKPEAISGDRYTSQSMQFVNQ